MKLRCLPPLLALALVSPSPARAEPKDYAAARELLKRGYALKKQGRCAEALEPLLESLRLDSQLKTLMNVADCEEQLGQLGQAQKHWILARDAAAQQDNPELKAEVKRRLVELEARMPTLRIHVTSTVPGQEVRRDGVLLSQASLELALPADPGPHQILVSAPGHQDTLFGIELAERDAKSLAVSAGAPLPTSAPAKSTPEPLEAAVVAPIAPPPASEPTQAALAVQPTGEYAGFWTPQRAVSVGLAGVGAVAFGVAGLAWIRANNLHDEALATCRPVCTTEGYEKQADALEAAQLTTIFLVSGSVLVASGAVLWFTAPSGSKTAGVAPLLGRHTAGLSAFGVLP